MGSSPLCWPGQKPARAGPLTGAFGGMSGSASCFATALGRLGPSWKQSRWLAVASTISMLVGLKRRARATSLWTTGDARTRSFSNARGRFPTTWSCGANALGWWPPCSGCPLTGWQPRSHLTPTRLQPAGRSPARTIATLSLSATAAEIHPSGVHRKTGFRAAWVSSSRRSGAW